MSGFKSFADSLGWILVTVLFCSIDLWISEKKIEVMFDFIVCGKIG
jgi:hypothetical protein